MLAYGGGVVKKGGRPPARILEERIELEAVEDTDAQFGEGSVRLHPSRAPTPEELASLGARPDVVGSVRVVRSASGRAGEEVRAAIAEEDEM